MVCVATVFIRLARSSDAREFAELCAALWPDGSVEEHLREVEPKITSGKSGTLPVGLIVAEDADGVLAGFIEVGLRSHADGCDTTRPVGYIEGWFVRESFRGKGIGRELMQAAEDWSRKQGCTEIASDALIENLPSQEAHGALGFEVVDRCVHFKKSLDQGTGSQS
jgi:aminoglycoside 6'-N-acetyltransferase I